ncbi:DUF2157 domain-containing protein [Saccharopolyspora taberi]|uniref:DUF2157 domain-containing protein n=1 Tax=Saccharopolyspora taberi TaxID=60895 RepID=A0ABN3VJM0_9PSEU
MRYRLTPEQHKRLEDLAERGVISREQAAEVRDALDSDRGAPAGGGLWEVLGYVGGALVLGGASLLVGMSWDDLPRPAKVGLLAAATLVLVVVGLVIGGERQGPRGRIVSVLFALASGTAALTVGSALDEYESLAATATGLLVAVLGYVVVRGIPVLLAAVAFSAGLVLAGAGEWFDSSTPSVSAGLIVLGALWTALALVLEHRRVAYGSGVVVAMIGAQYAVSAEQPWWGYGLTLLIAALCFGAYLVERSAVLLALGVVGVTLAVPEAVWDWTDGALSGPLLVLLTGVVFLVAGGVGLRLRRAKG